MKKKEKLLHCTVNEQRSRRLTDMKFRKHMWHDCLSPNRIILNQSNDFFKNLFWNSGFHIFKWRNSSQNNFTIHINLIFFNYFIIKPKKTTNIILYPDTPDNYRVVFKMFRESGEDFHCYQLKTDKAFRFYLSKSTARNHIISAQTKTPITLCWFKKRPITKHFWRWVSPPL